MTPSPRPLTQEQEVPATWEPRLSRAGPLPPHQAALLP